jgi:hypothetical protein
MIYDSDERVSFFQAWFCKSKVAVRKKKEEKKIASAYLREIGARRGIYDQTDVRFIIAKFAISAARPDLYTVNIRDGD